MNWKTLLLLTLLPSTSLAADLRIYPTFTEVQQPAAPTFTFPLSQWRWIQPGSFTVTGAPAALSLQPADLDWLRAQQGQAVTWVRPGHAPVPATLDRAEDLLLRLATGEFVHAQRHELAFPDRPPLQGGVTVTLNGLNTTTPATLLYRTQALAWQPRYALNAQGTAATLAALAQITNLSDQVFTAQKVDLYAGSVQQPSGPVPGQVQVTSAEVGGGGGQLTAAADVTLNQIRGVGEVRGLQRYTLPGGLTAGRGESLIRPFLTPKVSAFTRYANVQSYFDGQNRSGAASRRYKFTSSLSLPTGGIDVREGGLLVGSVVLPAVQAGRPVDLDLGVDPELRYVKTVKRTGVQKDEQGRVLSTSFGVTYAFVSTKSSGIKVNVREQLYARSVSVDGQTPQAGQVALTRQVNVPAGGKASLSFTLKMVN
ncbi:hypothetical protein [Deinococcus ficus]|uniref:hypothetical protein n=1 Tax=Deinococcus ficus TaxID=317577 RepID=UPI0003F50157|nr:hypothetical protein [Deinococcus ficus]